MRLLALIENGIVVRKAYEDAVDDKTGWADVSETPWVEEGEALDASILRRAKSEAAASVRRACKAANESGFYSTALDGVTQYHYSTDNSFGDSSFDGIDMVFLNAAYANAVANRAAPGWTVGYPCRGPLDATLKEYPHTAEQMIAAGQDGLSFIKSNRQKLRSKLVAIATATTLADVRAAAVW